MGWLDWIGPTSLTTRRGWGDLPAQKSVAPDFIPRDAVGTVAIVNRLVQTPAPYDGRLGGDGNSAVFACLQLIATALTEPPFRVYRVTRDERSELPPSPLSDLLERPNPSMTFRAMLAYLSTCLHVDGNAYWRKLRAGDPETGNVVELWPIAPSRIEPITRPGSSDFISFYRYRSGRGSPEEISPLNVVHFRYGLDDADHRKGQAPIKRLLREISSDEQATRYADRLLANLAINGLSLSFDKESPPIDQPTADELKLRVAAAYGGDNVGSVAVLSPGATLTQLGFSPEQMDLRVLHQVPEERIAAVLGVPAGIVGLGAGLEHQIYNNVQQAEEHFTERKLGPLWADIGDTLSLSLVPDFTSDRAVRIEADTSDVRALADDQNANATRLKTLVEAGILSVDEARAELGLDALPSPAEAPGAAERRIVALDTRGRRSAALGASRGQKSASDLPDRYADLAEDSLPTWESELVAFFNSQMRRVTRRLGAGADVAGDLVPDGEATLLGETLIPLQTRTLGDVSRLVMAELGISFQLDDPATRAYLRSCGVNIVAITDTTRAAVQDALTAGQAEGEGIDQLARRLRDLPAFGQARAVTVSRTELGHAQNTAALTSYRASGVVVGVRVHDGDYDEACQAMNGRTFPLDQAPPTLQHPRCLRAFAPLVDADELTRSA